VAVAAVVVLAACGGGGGDSADNSSDDANAGETSPSVDASGEDPASTAAAGSLIVDDEINNDALNALVTDFAALDADQQRERLNGLSGEVERQMYEVSGLAQELGSPEAVDDSITQTAQWFADLAEQTSTSIGSAALEPQGFRGGVVAPAGVPSLGEGVFGALITMIVGSEAAVTATNDGQVGKQQLGEGIKIEATKDKVELTTENKSTDKTGVTTTLSTRNIVAPCPKPDGTFEASASTDISSTINNGATGKRMTLDVTIKGAVDDNAGLIGYDVSSRVQYADFVASRGGFIDLTVNLPRGGPATAEFTRSGGTVTSQLIDDASSLSALLAAVAGLKLSEAAKMGWESGRCVALKVTPSAGPEGLTPSAVVSVLAEPRSKIDGAPTGGNVTATLSAGGASVEPNGSPVPADAESTYTAPSEQDQTGTVTYESRSRRGIGKAAVTFSTSKPAAYQVVGGLEDWQVEQVVCDITQPFTLTSPGVGVAEFSGGLSGTYSASGVFNFQYDGTYRITLSNGLGSPGSMVGTSGGSIADQAGSGSENYTLTPAKC